MQCTQPLVGMRRQLSFSRYRGIAGETIWQNRSPYNLTNSAESRTYSFYVRTSQWSETAAVVRQMDLILSIDTPVAHLARAMDTPVWLLLGPRPAGIG